MAAGGGAGAVTVWDLEARRLATVSCATRTTRR